MLSLDAIYSGHITLVEAALWVAWLNYWRFSAPRSPKRASAESTRAQTLHVVLLVVAAFLLFAPLPGNRPYDMVLPEGEVFAGIIGILLMLAGFGFCIWARRTLAEFWSGTLTLKEGHRLVQSGPYAWVRHPVYAGTLLAVLGRVITLDTLAGWLGFVLALVAYVRKMRREEALLAGHFGKEYEIYSDQVKALVPWLW